MKPRHIKKYRQLDHVGEHLLAEAVRHLGLSASTYHRVLKVAPSVAHLDYRMETAPHHLLETIQYVSVENREGTRQLISYPH
jgi:magnesium chelatase family protein